MQKILHFIKYNNTFTIILVLLLVSGGSAFANEDVRDTVIGETIEIKSGVDNSQIISADLQNFDMSLVIENVEENDASYIVDYSYKTMAIKDDVWQEVFRGGNLNVSKERIEGMDLGEYVAREIGELVDYEMRNLKEVQDIESDKGLEEQIVAVTYTGLKGLIFDNETKTIGDYEPIIKEERVELTGVFNPVETVSDDTQDDAIVIIKNTIVKEALPVNEIESVIQAIVNAELDRLEQIAQENITVTVSEETDADTATTTDSVDLSSEESDTSTVATSTTDGTDTTAPVITIQGNNPAEIEVGATYSDLGATVTDNVNDNLGITTYVDGVEVTQIVLDTASSTTYTITYSATDQAGNTGSATRTVTVSDPVVVVVEEDTDTATSTPEAVEEPIDVTDTTEEETATSTQEAVEEDTSTSTPQT